MNSPITVPIAEFSAMVRLLAVISVGAEFAERTHGNKHSETTKEKQEEENPARVRVAARVFIKGAIWMV